MTEPDEARRGEDQTATTAQDRLRTTLLIIGLSDWVSLAEVMTAITHYQLAETLAAQQGLVLRTIRSLLEDGLMQIGDLPGPDDDKFPAWDLTIDAAMKHVHDRFVRHYDDERWEYTIWLGLTDAGERTAMALQAETGRLS